MYVSLLKILFIYKYLLILVASFELKLLDAKDDPTSIDNSLNINRNNNLIYIRNENINDETFKNLIFQSDKGKNIANQFKKINLFQDKKEIIKSSEIINSNKEQTEKTNLFEQNLYFPNDDQYNIFFLFNTSDSLIHLPKSKDKAQYLNFVKKSIPFNLPGYTDLKDITMAFPEANLTKNSVKKIKDDNKITNSLPNHLEFINRHLPLDKTSIILSFEVTDKHQTLENYKSQKIFNNFVQNYYNSKLKLSNLIDSIFCTMSTEDDKKSYCIKIELNKYELLLFSPMSKNNFLSNLKKHKQMFINQIDNVQSRYRNIKIKTLVTLDRKRGESEVDQIDRDSLQKKLLKVVNSKQIELQKDNNKDKLNTKEESCQEVTWYNIFHHSIFGKPNFC